MANKTKSASSTARRQRHYAKLPKKKDLRVLKSSHGKFKTVAALEEHRKKVSGTPQSKTWVRKQKNKKNKED